MPFQVPPVSGFQRVDFLPAPKPSKAASSATDVRVIGGRFRIMISATANAVIPQGTAKSIVPRPFTVSCENVVVRNTIAANEINPISFSL